MKGIETMEQRVLKPDTIYVAHDRYVCGDTACAGASAVFTGYTIGGARVTKLTRAEARQWPVAELGPLRCDCGRLQADADGTVSGGAR